MILTDEQITSRLESPLNLINRLKKLTDKSNSMDLFIPTGFDVSSVREVSVVGLNNESSAVLDDDSLDDIIPDSADKIKMGLVKSKALDVLHDSLSSLHIRLPEIDKVRDLSTIASDMNRILTAEDATKGKINQQVIIYKPIVNDISKYDTLVVSE